MGKKNQKSILNNTYRDESDRFFFKHIVYHELHNVMKQLCNIYLYRTSLSQNCVIHDYVMTLCLLFTILSDTKMILICYHDDVMT